MTWYIFIILSGLGGLAFVYLGLRGPYADHHPRCRRCRYDLLGATRGALEVCPECGCPLSDAGAVRYGRRRRRPVLISLGGAGLVATAAMSSWVGWEAAVQFDWSSVKPLWWLRHDSLSDDTDVAMAAITEMYERLEGDGVLGSAGDLSLAQTRGLLEHALAVAQRRGLNWSARWGPFFEVAWRRGQATRDQVERYVQRACRHEIDIAVRPVVRRNSVLPLRIDYAQSGPPDQPHFVLRYELERASLAGSELPDVFDLRNAHVLRPKGGSRMFFLPVRCRSGEHELVFRYRVRLGYSGAPGSWETISQWSAQKRIPVTVVPQHHASVTSARNAPASAVRSAITVDGIRDGELTISARTPPVDLAFQVVVVAKAREWRAGVLTAARGRYASATLNIPRRFLEVVEEAQVVLRPSVAAAERTLDVTAIWPEDVVFAGVPVEADD